MTFRKVTEVFPFQYCIQLQKLSIETDVFQSLCKGDFLCHSMAWKREKATEEITGGKASLLKFHLCGKTRLCIWQEVYSAYAVLYLYTAQE